MLYTFMMAVSFLIRNRWLPNPFDYMGHQVIIPIGMIELPIPPILLSMLVEPVLYAFTFAIVGLYYEKRSNPALGSLMYLGFYIIHVVVLSLMAHYNFSTIAVILIMFAYFVGHIVAFIVKSAISFKTSLRW